MSEMFNIKIDGIELQAAPGTTILEAAQSVGIEIPTLCHDKRIEEYGACGICVVEAAGIPKLLRACSTKISAWLGFVFGIVVSMTDAKGNVTQYEYDACGNLLKTTDANGKTIINKVNNIKTDVIIVKEGATLTIDGEGTIAAVTGNDGYAVISEGEVIINGGTYKAGVDGDGEANAVVYARGNGKVFVNGGEFPNEYNSTFVLNKKDANRATTVIEVAGGKFRNFDPANNAAEGANTNFVKEGYKSIANGEFFEVVFDGEDIVVNGTVAEEYTAEGIAVKGKIDKKFLYIFTNYQVK